MDDVELNEIPMEEEYGVRVVKQPTKKTISPDRIWGCTIVCIFFVISMIVAIGVLIILYWFKIFIPPDIQTDDMGNNHINVHT